MTQAAPKSDSPSNPECRLSKRVDLAQVQQHVSGPDAETGSDASANLRRWSIIPLSAGLCVVQAIATILAFETREMLLTSTLIPVVAFILMFTIVLTVNPVLRLVAAVFGPWARPLNRVELVCLFTAMLVTSGVSAIGLADPLIPLLAAPKNTEPGWNTPDRGWNEALVPSLNPKLYIQDPDAIKLFRQGVILKDARGRPMSWRHDANTLFGKFVYCWRVFMAIPWMVWFVPLGYWLIFITACYGIFYCLSYIVLSYWSDKEKLIFPLVRLYESVLPEDSHGRYRIPSLLRTAGFWSGFAASFLILGWNANVQDGWMKNRGLPPFPWAWSLGEWQMPSTAAYSRDWLQAGAWKASVSCWISRRWALPSSCRLR